MPSLRPSLLEEETYVVQRMPKEDFSGIGVQQCHALITIFGLLGPNMPRLKRPDVQEHSGAGLVLSSFSRTVRTVDSLAVLFVAGG